MASAKIAVRVQASARTNEIVGLRDGVLVIRVQAPALEGRANQSLRHLVAKRLRLPKSSVTIVRGERSRDKLVQIDGVDQARLLEALREESSSI